jgi:DNA-binding MarR family transcriptional regulator
MRNIDRSSSPDLIAAILAEVKGSLRELRCGTTERMIRLGVSMTQMHVLWLLEHHGDVPMSRLADLLDVSVSNSTGLIDRMEEHGLVERVRVPDDRRLVLVRLGPEGIRVLRELEDSHHDRLQRALAHLEPARLCGVLEAFTDFHSAIEADLGPHTHVHALLLADSNPTNDSNVPDDPAASPAQPAPFAN